MSTPDDRDTRVGATQPSLYQRLLLAFEVSPEGRLEVVSAMLEGHVRRAASYWMNLSLATAIATLGLVLGSTGVVIGAMLISPLMGPIVGLGMGLAVGSPLLVIRSLVRVAGSLALVVAASTIITLALPFQEATAEIAARTSPTVLDLLVAIACALAAALTTMRPMPDSASTAAGTAIGISLVPPLCVVGFGLGASQSSVSLGAGLLFVANLCAILLFATLTFWLFGFNEPAVRQLEDALGSEGRPIHRLAAFVRAAFGSRYSAILRLLMPLALVGLVYVPLRRALSEVSWEVRVRTQLQRLLGELPLARSAVRSQLSLDGHRVHVRLVVVSDAERAAELHRTIELRAAEIAGVQPSIEVQAVPDVEALRQATRVPRVVAPEPPPPPDVPELSRRFEAGLARSWPLPAGPLLATRLDVSRGLMVELIHLGPPLGPSAETLLASALAEAVGVPLHVVDRPVPSGTLEAPSADGLGWLPSLIEALAWVDRLPDLRACVTIPPPPSPPRGRGPIEKGTSAEAAARALVEREMGRARPGAVARAEADRWSVRLQIEPCQPPAPLPDLDAGASEGGVPEAGVPEAGVPEGGAPGLR